MTADLSALRWTCPRSLNMHGNRRASELLAEIPGDAGIDRYGDGGAVEALEAEVRAILGKPAAVFMPTGTMAQQIALRVHADRRGSRTVAFHPTCHLELHEDKAYQHMHGLVGRRIGGESALITAEDIAGVAEPLAAVLFELPQREIGGQLPAWDDLRAQVERVRARGAAVHLDGARIWECTPYYGNTPADIAALFDTVYASLYKGIGGLGGCCLAGEDDVIAEARDWRHRHGGMLFALWPYAASALAALRKRLPLMPRYYAHALDIAEALHAIPGVEIVPDPPQTNMMHIYVRVSEERFLENARAIAEGDGIFTWPGSAPSPIPSMRVLELGVGDATLTFSPEEVATLVERLVS